MDQRDNDIERLRSKGLTRAEAIAEYETRLQIKLPYFYYSDYELNILLKKCDALEVAGVKEDDGHCERVEKGEEPDFYSVYARHIPTGENNQFGGVECLADFKTREHALQYANTLGLKVKEL